MRVLRAVSKLFKHFFTVLKNEDMRALLSLMLVTLVIGTCGFSLIEKYSLFHSLYLSFMTLATIGFGDIHPVTTLGKVFTMIYATFGLGIMSIFISTLINYSIHSHEKHYP